jgi:hypothetical protein
MPASSRDQRPAGNIIEAPKRMRPVSVVVADGEAERVFGCDLLMVGSFADVTSTWQRMRTLDPAKHVGAAKPHRNMPAASAAFANSRE